MSELLCDGCGQPLGAPHTPLDTDCVLPHPEAPHTERGPHHGQLCPRHYGWLLDTLRQIGELWSLRAVVLLPGATSDGTGRSATRFGSPAPGNIAVMSLADRRGVQPDPDDPAEDRTSYDVPGTLQGWARRVLRETGQANRWASERTAPGGSRQLRVDVEESLRVLLRERRYIARAPWLTAFVYTVTELHHALAEATRAGMWARSIGSCPNCGRKLYPTIGVDVVVCRKCGSEWRGPDLVRLRLIHEQEKENRSSSA